MADDPYKTLGVDKSASAEDIRAAYRKLAKKHHPDLNPGNKAAEEAFKKLTAANDLLSDPEKRARYDRGEIDASGAERERPRTYRNYAESSRGERYAHAGAGLSAAASPTKVSRTCSRIFSSSAVALAGRRAARICATCCRPRFWTR